MTKGQEANKAIDRLCRCGDIDAAITAALKTVNQMVNNDECPIWMLRVGAALFETAQQTVANDLMGANAPINREPGSVISTADLTPEQQKVAETIRHDMEIIVAALSIRLRERRHDALLAMRGEYNGFSATETH